MGKKTCRSLLALTIAFLALMIPAAFAQTYATVTATVTDPNSNPYAGAQYSLVLTDSLGNALQSAVLTSGALYNASPVRGNLTNSGYLSASLIPNSQLTTLTGSPTRWQINIAAPKNSYVLLFPPSWTISYLANITGSADLSSQVSSLAQAITFINLQTGQSTIAGSGASGFPFTLGSTSVTANSAISAVSGLMINGVTLSAGGSPTTFLNGSGGYTTPSGSGTVNSGTAGQIAYYGASGTAVSGTGGLPNGTTATTQTAGDNTTAVATDAFVLANASASPVNSVFTRTGAVTAQSGDYTVSQVTGAAPLASPTFTGIPAAPTATVGTNTTQIATTAFVLANLPTINTAPQYTLPMYSASGTANTLGASQITSDASGDVVAAGTGSFGGTSGQAGALYLKYGTAASVLTSGINIFAPTAGTAYGYTWPGSTGTGYLYNNGSGVGSWSTPTAAGAAGGDLTGTYPNPVVAQLDGVPFCTGYTPTTGQSVTYTTASSPNPCYTASTPSGTGTVTTVSVATANGVSGTVATATTTPAITLTLGAITPTTVDGLTLTPNTTGFSIAGGSTTSNTVTWTGSSTYAGTNTAVYTFPTANATIPSANGTTSITGGWTFGAGTLKLNGGTVNGGETNTTACTGAETVTAGTGLYSCQLTGNVTATLAAPASGAGAIVTIQVIQTASNTYSFTFPSNIGGGLASTAVTPTAGKASTYTLQYTANTAIAARWLLISSQVNQ